jgi:hypothetical protein
MTSKEAVMDKRQVGYWAAVGLFSAVYFASGVADVFRLGPVPATLAHLGYPVYVASILGPWKIAAVVALLAPAMPRVKEWAYAGIVFDLTGGLVSHLVNHDPLPKPLVPVIVLGFALTSYLLRPASRQLDSPRAVERPGAATLAQAR